MASLNVKQGGYSYVKEHNNKVFGKYSALVQRNLKKALDRAGNTIIGKLSTEISNGGWWVYDHDRSDSDKSRSHSIDTWEATPVFSMNSSLLSVKLHNSNPGKDNQQYIPYLINNPYHAGDKSGLTKQKWSTIRNDMRKRVYFEIRDALFARK